MPHLPSVDQANSELEALQHQVNKKTDESLECTKRILGIGLETEEVGAGTLVNLHAQGKQLDNIEIEMGQINENMRQANKNLRDMERCCCGLCVLPCNKSKNIGEDDKAWKSNVNAQQTCHVQPTRVRSDANESNGLPNGGYIDKITNDAREDEMDDNLAQVSNLLGKFRSMANEMDLALSKQNTQIDRINEKGILNEISITAGNDRANKILKK